MVLGHDILTSDRTQDIKISEDVSFDTMLLAPQTLKGLKASGFYVPSPIQLHGIPLGKCGFDLLLEAKSGTGKTAVFAVIALEKLDLEKGVQTMILAPTREIASQICDVVRTIGAYYEGLSVEVVMGGLPFDEDVVKFKKRVHIVVGSPGRLHYLIRGKHIDVSSVRLMVLDEADKLLEKSFLSDINHIFTILPCEKQVIMSSATFPENAKTILNNYVQSAHHICPDTSSVLLGIEQNVTVVPSHVNVVKQTQNKYQELLKILSKKQFKQCLIFCNYQVRVVEVQRMLKRDKWPADKLYGKQEQTDRLEALKILQAYECRILVTTDLTARGIDASNVDLVINFEMPHDWQTYMHRIGRAGRFGSYGSAITILSEGGEIPKFKKLLGAINIPFNLKNIWSQEPFLIDSPRKSHEICHKEEAEQVQTKSKEPEAKLSIKEAYEELWNKLSYNPTQTTETEILDIPTFDSLCESFKQAHMDSDKIDSFSDLLSSFENHEIKSKDKVIYKPVEVNKLIIPHTIFNRNVVLKSFQNNKKVVKLTNNNNIYTNYKCDKANGAKDNNDTVSKKVNSICKSGSSTDDDDDDSYDSGKESKVNDDNNTLENKSFNCKYNENAKVSKDHQTETAQDDLYLPSTSSSSTYRNNARSSSNKSINNCYKRSIEHKENTSLSPDQGSCPWSGITQDDSLIASTSSTGTKSLSKRIIEHKSHIPNKTVPKNNGKREEYGKSNPYNTPEICLRTPANDDEKNLLAANLPIAFGKSKANCSKSKRHRQTSQTKYNTPHNPNNIEYDDEPDPRIYVNQRESFIESADNEKGEANTVSYESIKNNKSKNKQNVNNHRTSNNNNEEYNYTRIQENQQTYYQWSQGLLQNREMVEIFVYIDFMGRDYFYEYL